MNFETNSNLSSTSTTTPEANTRTKKSSKNTPKSTSKRVQIAKGIKHPRTAVKTIKNRYIEIFKGSMQILMQMILLPLSVTFETAITGNFFGTTSLAGVSVGAVIIDTILGITTFVIFSSNSSIAGFVGGKKIKSAVTTIFNTLLLSLFLGILITVLGYALLPHALYLFDIEPAVREVAYWYAAGYMICFPVLVIDMAGSGILRGLKKYKSLSVATLSSFFLNFLFIYIFAFVLGWGIWGLSFSLALGVFVETIVKMILILNWIIKNYPEYKTVKPSFDGMLNDFILGLPLLVRSVLVWSTNIFMVYSFGVLGTEAVAAVQVVDAIWIYVIFILDSVGQVNTTLSAERIGRGDFEGAVKINNMASRVGQIYAGLLTFFLLATWWFLPNFFSSDPQVLQYSIVGWFEGAVATFVTAYAFCFDGAMTASRDGKYQAFTAFCSTTIYLASGFLAINLVPHNIWGFLIILSTYDLIFFGMRFALAKYRKNKDRWLKHAKHEYYEQQKLLKIEAEAKAYEKLVKA